VAPGALRASADWGREVSPAVLRRARWFATTVGALRRVGAREIEVDLMCKSAFRRLSVYPECSSLKEMCTVPATMIHHAIALGRIRAARIVAEEERLDGGTAS